MFQKRRNVRRRVESSSLGSRASRQSSVRRAEQAWGSGAYAGEPPRLRVLVVASAWKAVQQHRTPKTGGVSDRRTRNKRWGRASTNMSLLPELSAFYQVWNIQATFVRLPALEGKENAVAQGTSRDCHRLADNLVQCQQQPRSGCDVTRFRARPAFERCCGLPAGGGNRSVYWPTTR